LAEAKMSDYKWALLLPDGMQRDEDIEDYYGMADSPGLLVELKDNPVFEQFAQHRDLRQAAQALVDANLAMAERWLWRELGEGPALRTLMELLK
jgi:hypothetical protein